MGPENRLPAYGQPQIGHLSTVKTMHIIQRQFWIPHQGIKANSELYKMYYVQH